LIDFYESKMKFVEKVYIFYLSLIKKKINPLFKTKNYLKLLINKVFKNKLIGYNDKDTNI